MANKKISNEDIVGLGAQGLLYISEIEAKVPWYMGINAKNCLRRDAFLINFLPKITPELMKRHGWESRGEMEQAVAGDTRLLAEVAEEAVNDMEEKTDWREAVQEANSIRRESEDLVSLIELYHKKKDRPEAVEFTSEEQVMSHLKRLRSMATLVQASQKNLEAQRAKYKGEADPVLKCSMLAAIRAEENKISSALSGIAKEKYLLAVNDQFKFSKNKDDLTFEEYVARDVVQAGKAKAEALKKKYLEKYGAAPKFLGVYEKLLDDLTTQLFLTDEPQTDVYKLAIEKDMMQYISIMEDGPNVILQCSRMYPKLQQNLENEILFERADEGALTAKLAPENEFKAIHRMPWSFTGMLGKEHETVLDSPSDKLICSLVGPPGIGKTAMMESIARQMGFLFKSISIPHCDSSLFGGLATVTNKDQVKQLASQDMADAITDYGIIDLEEATAAPDNSVHLQMARFLQTGAIGINRLLHPLTVTVMTSNDNIIDNADIKPFNTVIMNRIDTLQIKDPRKIINKWCSWILNSPAIQGDPDAVEAFTHIITFLKYSPDGHLYDGVSQESINLRSGQEGQANPSPRSWYNFAEKIGTVVSRKDLSVEERGQMIRKHGIGIIGPAATEKFVEHYIVSAKIPTVDELLSRVDAAKPGWHLLDAIRVFDMNSNIVDTHSRSNLMMDDERGAASTRRKKAKARYTLTPDPAYDDSLIQKQNNLFMEQYLKHNNGAGPRQVDKSILMDNASLEANYNKIWGSDEIDINNAAVMFNLSNQISAQVDRLFEDAYYGKHPVDGEKLQKLFILAMTIPAKDYRTALITNMYHKILSTEKFETFYTRGVTARNAKNELKVLKYIPSAYTERATGKLIRPDQDEVRKELSKDAGVAVVDRPYHISGIAYLLTSISESFNLVIKEDQKDQVAASPEAAGR